MDEEGKELLDSQNPNNANRLIIVSFGDLKNYVYHYKVVLPELAGNFVVSKSNKISKFVNKEDIERFSSLILRKI